MLPYLISILSNPAGKVNLSAILKKQVNLHQCSLYFSISRRSRYLFPLLRFLYYEYGLSSLLNDSDPYFYSFDVDIPVGIYPGLTIRIRDLL